MMQIRKAILDCRGDTVARGTLPLRFTDRAAAVAFLEWYLTAVFAEGRSGYQARDGYWWGCDPSEEAYLHCYTVADEAPAAVRARSPRRRHTRREGSEPGGRHPNTTSG